MSSECYVIAEIGLNHNGSIDLAKKLIDVAKKCGVDAVKFQKRTVECLAIDSILNAKDDRFPEFGNTYKEIRNYLEFNLSEYIELKQYAKSKKLDFLVTAFDIEAVDFLEKISVDKYKVASHSLTNLDLLKYIAMKNTPVIMSTGMCEIDDIDRAVSIFKDSNTNLSLLHCVSAYPTPLEECNLLALKNLKARYDLVTGYSGHEVGFLPTLLAVAMGAEIIERHITLDKNMIGFDHKISLEPNELEIMVSQIRAIPKIMGDGQKHITNKATSKLLYALRTHGSNKQQRNNRELHILRVTKQRTTHKSNGIPMSSLSRLVADSSHRSNQNYRHAFSACNCNTELN